MLHYVSTCVCILISLCVVLHYVSTCVYTYQFVCRVALCIHVCVYTCPIVCLIATAVDRPGTRCITIRRMCADVFCVRANGQWEDLHHGFPRHAHSARHVCGARSQRCRLHRLHPCVILRGVHVKGARKWKLAPVSKVVCRSLALGQLNAHGTCLRL